VAAEQEAAASMAAVVQQQVRPILAAEVAVVDGMLIRAK
jgi:hypothetical protein